MRKHSHLQTLTRATPTRRTAKRLLWLIAYFMSVDRFAKIKSQWFTSDRRPAEFCPAPPSLSSAGIWEGARLTLYLPPKHSCPPLLTFLPFFFGPTGHFPTLTSQEQGGRLPEAGTLQADADRGRCTSGGTSRRGENWLFSSAMLRGKTPQTTAFDKGLRGSFYNRTTTGFFLPQKEKNQVIQDALNWPRGLRTVTKEPYFRLSMLIP